MTRAEYFMWIKNLFTFLFCKIKKKNDFYLKIPHVLSENLFCFFLKIQLFLVTAKR